MLKYIFFYFLVINLIGFFIMFIDKQRAKHKKWRIPEKNLLGISILGGSIGMLLGMSSFRHKTNHKKFTVGVPAILIIQFIMLAYYLKQIGNATIFN